MWVAQLKTHGPPIHNPLTSFQVYFISLHLKQNFILLSIPFITPQAYVLLTLSDKNLTRRKN